MLKRLPFLFPQQVVKSYPPHGTYKRATGKRTGRKEREIIKKIFKKK
jgi:hypothetical protein